MPPAHVPCYEEIIKYAFNKKPQSLYNFLLRLHSGRIITQKRRVAQNTAVAHQNAVSHQNAAAKYRAVAHKPAAIYLVKSRAIQLICYKT